MYIWLSRTCDGGYDEREDMCPMSAPSDAGKRVNCPMTVSRLRRQIGTTDKSGDVLRSISHSGRSSFFPVFWCLTTLVYSKCSAA